VLYPLARHAIDVKGTLLESPALLANLDRAFGLDPQIIAVTVVSSVERDDEDIQMGSFSAGFHTHRLRMYAHHRPFMAVLLFSAVSCFFLGAFIVFEVLMTVLLKKTALIFQEKDSDVSSGEMDTPLSSEKEDEHLFEQLVPTTPHDELRQSSDRGHDDILERLLQRATCTPPRKLKTEGISIDFPTFEYTHSMDESFDRSVSRGASPRKRRTERHDVESDLEMVCRKL
jgi:hypothetical protein